MTTTNLAMRLSAETWDRVREAALSEGVSPNQLVGRALADYAERHDATTFALGPQPTGLLTDFRTVRVDADLRRRIKELATAVDRDMTYITRVAINEYIEQHGK